MRVNKKYLLGAFFAFAIVSIPFSSVAASSAESADAESSRVTVSVALPEDCGMPWWFMLPKCRIR